MTIRMWDKHNISEVDQIDYGYDVKSGQFQGTLYVNGEAIGTFMCDSYAQIRKWFKRKEQAYES